MGMKNLREAQKKKAHIENTLEKLRKDSRTEDDKSKKKKIKKEIKKLEGSLPALRRYIYVNSKDQIREKKDEKRREELVKQQSEAERERLIQQDLENRKNRKSVVSSSNTWNDISDKSQLICQSCGIKIRNVYEDSRCGCN
ncbi:hypothetical protein [Metabacillus halosaccharovorans]|uniref:Uncharacterized protein n=1 Tax=Metabacillus halosaccharovorans TaxID=930124 RepID=A0ABT3DDR7_9BACI|nr:hypothetical protein [Metabacillus halosaccharovorans]MCV9885131.1 hypothetical protein [Metabacillus halosaccharovorans]